MFIAWFTFFVTINYAVMGWLLASLFAAKSLADVQPRSERLLALITVVFALQNLLGFCGCFVVRSHLIERAMLIRQIEAALSSPDADGTQLPSFETTPVRVYVRTLNLMAVVLVLMLVAWCLLPILSRQ
jgi:hypothetical protein